MCVPPSLGTWCVDSDNRCLGLLRKQKGHQLHTQTCPWITHPTPVSSLHRNPEPPSS